MFSKDMTNDGRLVPAGAARSCLSILRYEDEYEKKTPVIFCDCGVRVIQIGRVNIVVYDR
jgi:hypothetical protein